MIYHANFRFRLLDLDHIKTFAKKLRSEVAPYTVWGVLQALARALRAMAPDCDLTQLHKVLTRLKRRVRPVRDIDKRLIAPDQLVTIGERMMDEADARKRGKKAAVLYRNGLIIVCAALCPLRRRNWGAVLIGQHLQIVGRRALLSFNAAELKSSSTPIQMELPSEHTARIVRYLECYRPLLLLPECVDPGFLWLNWSGQPLQGTPLGAAVERALTKRCGKHFTFHMFRHSAATFIEQVAPEWARMAAPVLQHSDFRTTRKYYIRGQRTAAMRQYQSLVRSKIKRGRRTLRRSKPKKTRI